MTHPPGRRRCRRSNGAAAAQALRPGLPSKHARVDRHATIPIRHLGAMGQAPNTVRHTPPTVAGLGCCSPGRRRSPPLGCAGQVDTAAAPGRDGRCLQTVIMHRLSHQQQRFARTAGWAGLPGPEIDTQQSQGWTASEFSRQPRPPAARSALHEPALHAARAAAVRGLRLQRAAPQSRQRDALVALQAGMGAGAAVSSAGGGMPCERAGAHGEALQRMVRRTAPAPIPPAAARRLVGSP